MSFRQDAARLRRELLQRPGFYPSPRCPLCGSECTPAAYAAHTKQCEKDCASEVIQACDKHLLAIRNTIPRNPEHAVLLDVDIAWTEQERTLAYNVVFGLDELGRGTMHTGLEGWPHDGCSF
jgi:hypothetical protein